MSPEHLIPGFFGKIPATGDFVTRRLPSDFVRFWDRLAARQLVPLLKADRWPPDTGLGFLLHMESRGPVTGVSVPSRDRVGRRFPLTAAVSCPHGSPDMIAGAAIWFEAIGKVLMKARDEAMDADQLAAALAALPFAELARSEAGPLHGLLLWAGRTAPAKIDPEAPYEALEELFAPLREAG
jgi:type VI secretion system protein ImpM